LEALQGWEELGESQLHRDGMEGNGMVPERLQVYQGYAVVQGIFREALGLFRFCSGPPLYPGVAGTIRDDRRKRWPP
jgi:hypothetical protein